VKGWATIRLPLELSLHPVDVFLGMSQMVPKHAGASIGFIYDLGYIHRPESYPGSYEKLKKQTEEVCRVSKKIFTISKAVKSDIVSTYHIPSKNIAVGYPGIDERFKKSGKAQQTSSRYFLFVGALKPGKNVPGILRGFAKFLEESHTRFSLYLVGGNYWEDPEIDVTIQSLRIGDTVKKFGFVADEVLATYYRGAAGLVVPSFHEGFCIPAAEAIACGCPVLTSDTKVMREVLGNTGIFVDPTDSQQIAQGMRVLAYNAKKRADMSVKGLVHAKEYRWEKTAQLLLHEITSLSSTV
jgi:alpha-1,3-rhamnosyl/mannosyltransferase